MSTAPTEEQVLVIPTSVAIDALAYCARRMSAPPPNDRFQSADDSILLELMESAVFVPRGPAEDDPELKQLVVYAIIRLGDKTLCYTRGKAGCESRLHAKKSIGVGGHINPEDWDPALPSEQAFIAALLREVTEEIGVPWAMCGVRFLGLVNEDTTAVGKVHLGVVYEVRLSSEVDLSFESALLEPEWLDAGDMLACDTLEIWSALIRDRLSVVTTLHMRHYSDVLSERINAF